MEHDAEAQALREVQERLHHRFPSVGTEVVEAAVRLAHGHMTGPVRVYVPLLVEREARERLAHVAD